MAITDKKSEHSVSNLHGVNFVRSLITDVLFRTLREKKPREQ